MPKKKKSAPGEDGENVNGDPPSPATQSLPSPTTMSSPALKKPTKTKAPPPPPPPSQQVLVICRNKHWRYISSFHGPWLQLPPEILETIANANYNTPRPRPIDPAVFFDLVKIRRLVDEATNLAVRAASGVASIGHRTLPGASHHASALGLEFGLRPPPQTKLSPERKHRMREQATQKLVKAYRLDEIACSVATMQSASSLEEVASLVLQRNPQDPDAKYVHFFHEKIPSRQLAECTSLTPLNEIVAARPSDPEPLRTRAMVRVFKDDYQGAIDDLTEALKLHRLYRPAHTSRKISSQETQISEKQPQGNTRRQEGIILKEEDQPSSLEMQLLFQRAGVYLATACRHVATALPEQHLTPRGSMTRESDVANGHVDSDTRNETVATEQEQSAGLPTAAEEAQKRMAEARKLVRHNAKRALRDYTAYLAHFEYSPDLPIEIAEDFTRKVNFAVNGARVPRSHSYPAGPRSPVAGEGEPSNAPHRIYTLSDLFTPSPPSGLPAYPSTELVTTRQQQPPSPGSVQTTTETLTCHPLLTDALHALLLCHCLIQTSAKELLRHAYMVARLARLADGYPVFQSSRCPARADWVEVLRAGSNWIQLAGTWEDLCAPAPLPLFQSTGNGSGQVPVSLPPPPPPPPPPKRTEALVGLGGDSATTSPDSPTAPGSVPPPEIEKQREDGILHQAVVDALGDDRVNDESTFHLAIRARQLRAERDYRLDNAVAALDAKLARGELDAPRAAASVNNLTQPNAADATATATATATAASETEPHPQPQPQPQALIHTGSTATATPLPPTPSTPRSRAAFDDGRDYPISTERASAVARWVLEAPLPSAGSGAGGAAAGDGAARKRKKKPVKKAVGSAGAKVEDVQRDERKAGSGGGETDGDGDGEGEGEAGDGDGEGEVETQV
ncbi:Histidine kinase group protein [Madurella fahalii]|uniref:Histidine kinase group protein n=1 Tax=Madurella fahalii TaxID=1157608 RepID=A0ABQ0GLQ9_9PEZI